MTDELFCNPIDCSPPYSSVHVISQARILEWVAISFSSGSSWPRVQTRVSCIAGGFFTTEPPGKSINWQIVICLQYGGPTLIPGSERSPGERNGYPLQYSCQGNPKDRGAWWATIHRVAESDTTERLTLKRWTNDSHFPNPDHPPRFISNGQFAIST